MLTIAKFNTSTMVIDIYIQNSLNVIKYTTGLFDPFRPETLTDPKLFQNEQDARDFLINVVYPHEVQIIPGLTLEEVF